MRIVWRKPDGSLSITVPASPRLDGEDDAAYLDRVAARTQAATPSLADAARVYNVASADLIPGDRTFRGAWTIDGDVIRVDMGKAREIQKDRLRELRTPILAQLDKALERATDQRNNDEAARISARRQALRDVTAVPEIAAARTPDDLKRAGMEVIEAG